MKLSLFEDLNKDEEFILDLKKFTQTYPDKIEMKILLANKYRKLEQYEKAIKIYSEIINNKSLPQIGIFFIQEVFLMKE